ncbi:MAG TPA: nucleoside phosphorylase [Candidatus Krumholzibacteriaceae bacterium]|jgi:uridine phosphorylase|nr:nucleoside phosphorylase [Candidatus Krumholzibacteriaceae bacterium]
MHHTPKNIQYHINCKRGDLAQYLLVTGDPERIPKIARHWIHAKEVSSHREFRAFTGVYKNAKISAISSGIGPAVMSIVVNEAANIGVRTFIRVGSCGALQKNINCGDLIISSAAVRLDGTSNCYVIPEYPAVADYEVMLALIEAAESLGVKYHVGITATASDFYAGQARVSGKNHSVPQCENLIPALQKANVLNFEMETATLFVLCSLFGLKAGSVCAVYANHATSKFESYAGEEDCIRVANEAVKILDSWNKKKKTKKKKWLFPNLLR